jgi:phospholipid/cholesterol/gamma-HCH transport system substrate-binding protein
VAATLRPTPNKYYTLELVDDPRGVTDITRRVTRTTDPRLPPVVNTEEIVVRDSFRLSLQLNYKFWLVALRGGLIESTAGFGIDFLPWKNHIKIGAELFDIGLEHMPRLRISAVFNWWFFTIAGGVDDVLNDGNRDFFLGIGLQFTDDDLKAILPLLPIPR